MRKSGSFLASMILVTVLTVGLFWTVRNHNSFAALFTADHLDAQSIIAGLSTGSSPVYASTSDLGSDEIRPPNLAIEAQAMDVLPTPVPGETQVYFVPADSDATGTVLTLYNTDAVTHTVALRGFSYNGVLVYSLNIAIDPFSFKRLASDSIVSAPPPSWATPAPVITNFTDFTYFASLSLPNGVRAEGYVIFNPGTGVVDPRMDQGAIPLQFMPGPAVDTPTPTQTSTPTTEPTVTIMPASTNTQTPTATPTAERLYMPQIQS